MMAGKPIAILYEHPEWFELLFAELERRDVPYERLFVRDHVYDPAVRQCPHSLIVNRVSAYPSGGSHPGIVLYVRQYLAYLESIQANVVNGYFSYLVGTSKAMQLDILEQLGLCYPRARVIHHPGQALQAAEGLNFPILVKPNIGGSGAGIRKFDSHDELGAAVKAGTVDLGIDHTGLIQEHLPAKGEFIVRVEILNGEFLYAIRLPIAEYSFNYCPADGCNIDDPNLTIEGYTPPLAVVRDAKRILAASRADLGSVEYLINGADDRVYYYDINPLSNFVADAVAVVGFEPTERLVDFILERAGV
jgi:hypothetical protein